MQPGARARGDAATPVISIPGRSPKLPPPIGAWGLQTGTASPHRHAPLLLVATATTRHPPTSPAASVLLTSQALRKSSRPSYTPSRLARISGTGNLDPSLRSCIRVRISNLAGAGEVEGRSRVNRAGECGGWVVGVRAWSVVGDRAAQPKDSQGKCRRTWCAGWRKTAGATSAEPHSSRQFGWQATRGLQGPLQTPGVVPARQSRGGPRLTAHPWYPALRAGRCRQCGPPPACARRCPLAPPAKAQHSAVGSSTPCERGGGGGAGRQARAPITATSILAALLHCRPTNT